MRHPSSSARTWPRAHAALLGSLTVLLLAGLPACGGDDEDAPVECGGCAAPRPCGADPSSYVPGPCECGCIEGDVFGSGVCTQHGCIVPAPDAGP